MCRLFLLISLLFCFGINNPKGLFAFEINIITGRNGVGLDKDIDILTKELSELGHKVRFIEFFRFLPCAHADINIFLQCADEFYFPFADQNYLIPNQEWIHYPYELIPKFDLILCKTKEAERVFKPLNQHCIFTSFTSVDRFDPNVMKNYHSCLHLAGASAQKGTDSLVQIWSANPHYPLLNIIKHRGKKDYPKLSNLNLIYSYLSDSVLSFFQNECGFHTCTSETEGFGHYIMEALSCGAVVVTTNAPPMNEFVSDPRCLVDYTRTEPSGLATKYFFDPEKLTTILDTLFNLPEEELQEIGRKNRQFYLENDRFFKRKMAEIFST